MANVRQLPLPARIAGPLAPRRGSSGCMGERTFRRKKRYILEEGIPVPFLAVELGVQTKDGAIVHAKYDKFRQINRFLEFIEDVLPKSLIRIKRPGSSILAVESLI